MGHTPESEGPAQGDEHPHIFVSRVEKDINLNAALEQVRVRRIDLAAAEESGDAARVAEARTALAAAEKFFEHLNRGPVVPPLATPSWKAKKKE